MANINSIFKQMTNNKKVKITKSFRDYWGTCSGTWFTILSINSDDTVSLQDKNHSSFMNVPIKEIVI